MGNAIFILPQLPEAQFTQDLVSLNLLRKYLLAWHLNTEMRLAAILAFFLAGIGVSGWWYYHRQERAFEKAKQEELNAIAELRMSQIAHWREERISNAIALRETSLLCSSARACLEGTGDATTENQLKEWMNSFQRYQRFSRVVLLDSKLEARYAAPAAEGWVGDLGKQYAMAALYTNRVLVSDLHISRVSGRENMDLLVPIPCGNQVSNGSVISCGVFLLEVDPNDFLFTTLQKWPTPSRTAETLLIRREGDEVVYLNQLRHKTNTAIRFRLAIPSNPELVAVKAARGLLGVVRGVDYRGQKVLASVCRVADSPWIVVSKQDQDEVYAPLRALAWIIASTTTALMLATLLGVGMVWRNHKYHYSQKELALRQREEQALRQSTERFQNFTAAAFEGICVQEHGRIIDLNQQFADLFGWERTELIGREVLTLVSQESREVVCSVLQGDSEATYEHIALRKDGARFIAEVRAKMICWEGRKVRVSALRDITERQRLHQEVIRKNKELESVIYVSSHDLRSPLVNIQGFSHRLRSGCDQLETVLAGIGALLEFRSKIEPILQERIKPSLNFILSSVLKMDTLLNGLLRLSRLGRSAMRMEVLNMNQLAKAAVDSLAYQIQQAEASIALDRLPPCYGDASQLSQVLSNFLDNALKYRDPTRPLQVHVTGKAQSNDCIYCVEDNGLGIAPAHHEKIWEIFQRLDTSGSTSGEGLGLTIIRRILDRHGGLTWVESEPQKGSRFYFSLPSAPIYDTQNS